MTRDVDIETLRILVAVAEAGSVSAAAAMRGLSQPAASARVREFENRWHVAVVRRSPRGSRLTPDGEAVVNWARGVLDATDAMRTSLTALSERRRTSIVVAASLTVAEYLVPRWLAELHSRVPDVQPVLHVMNSEAVGAATRTGEADIGFIESTVLPSDLLCREVGSDPLAVVVAPDHPWARRRAPLARHELMQARWLVREEGSGTRSTFEDALGTSPRVAMEGSSTMSLISAAVAGLGPAVLSARSVEAEVLTRHLRVVPNDLNLDRPLTAVWRGDELLADPAAQLLAIALRSSPEVR